jgi:predicted membrane protein
MASGYITIILGSLWILFILFNMLLQFSLFQLLWLGLGIFVISKGINRVNNTKRRRG